MSDDFVFMLVLLRLQQKQLYKLVSLPTMQAKIIAAIEAIKKVIWLVRVYKETNIVTEMT